MMLLDLGKKGRGKEKRESKRERRACCFKREKKKGEWMCHGVGEFKATVTCKSLI